MPEGAHLSAKSVVLALLYLWSKERLMYEEVKDDFRMFEVQFV